MLSQQSIKCFKILNYQEFMIILTFPSHYAKRLNFSAHFAFFSPSFLLVYKSSRMAEWSALRWAGRPPGQSWGTPAASTCRNGHRQCRQFHRFLREFEICLATREIFFTLFHHIIVSKNVVCPAEEWTAGENLIPERTREELISKLTDSDTW